MSPLSFCYWLQGFVEMTALEPTRPAGMSPAQVKAIQEHLALVFNGVTEASKAAKEATEKAASPQWPYWNPPQVVPVSVPSPWEPDKSPYEVTCEADSGKAYCLPDPKIPPIARCESGKDPMKEVFC